jgi:hypothetical protein
VADSHANTCDLSHPGTPSATVVLLRAGLDDIEYLVLSDALIVVDTGDGVVVLTDPSVNDLAVDERKAVLRARIGTPERSKRW